LLNNPDDRLVGATPSDFGTLAYRGLTFCFWPSITVGLMVHLGQEFQDSSESTEDQSEVYLDHAYLLPA
jgi:hypothetical protein